MKIVIDVSSYYDWIPLSHEEQEAYELWAAEHKVAAALYVEWQRKTEAERAEQEPPVSPPAPEILEGLMLKPDASGKMLKRTVVDCPSFTEIGIPPQQLLAQSGLPPEQFDEAARRSALLVMIEKRVMPMNAPRSSWRYIYCDSEPEIEKYLNAVFSLEKSV